MPYTSEESLQHEAEEAIKAAEPRIESALAPRVSQILSISEEAAHHLIGEVARLYSDRMTARFTDLRFNIRIKRTNPFLLQVRGVKTVREWAENQVRSSLFASEEEAIGHVLEHIAKACHPGGQTPELPIDFDFEVRTDDTVTAYQVKMSWDCMNDSARKNLSNTVAKCKVHYASEGKKFEGIFAPCYGRPSTSKSDKREYIVKRSRDFWAEVGSGDVDYDFKVGEVCHLLCSEFRDQLNRTAIPDLIKRLTDEGSRVFGDADGKIDYLRLFREINR